MSCNFNSHIKSAEGLLINGQAKLFREPKTFSALIKKQLVES